VIAAVKGDKKALVSESADLIYHWLVVLGIAGVALDEVLKELEAAPGARASLRRRPGRRADGKNG